jgi:hypothetical protein
MSTPPPANPKDPKEAAKKEMTNAVTWTVIAAAVAVGLFVYSGKVEPDKKNFYVIAAAVGAIVAAVNGYGAWTAYNKSKSPPK